MRLTLVATCALALLGGVWPAAAEELVLKDGQKIVGTIVGYENDMFRVQTEFGFALVRKDKVASVNFGAGGSEGAAGKRGEAKSTAAAARRAGSKPGKTSGAEPVGAESVPAAAVVPSANPSPAPAPPPKPAVPVSRPVDEPLPPHMQERVEGNNYFNDTFQFAMFKPPGWKIYEGVTKETGSGIVALGTEDEQTLLIVDRQVWSGAPDLKSDQVEARLRRTYQDYKRLAEAPTQLDGQPGIRHAFTGVLDGAEWHGVSVHVARGKTVFGIIGLTSTETFEFHQAILNKIINSFHFLISAPEPRPAPASSGAP
jgi:hypothetical protein